MRGNLDDFARELRAAADNATEGPWEAGDKSRAIWTHDSTIVGSTAIRGDCKFIALANPENIQALLDDRDELLLAVRRIHVSQEWVPLGVDLGRWWSPGDPYPPETPEEIQAREDAP